MKRFLSILVIIVSSMVSLFALTNVQTIVLVSVVRPEMPSFVMNGYTDNGVIVGGMSDEIAILSSDITKDTNSHFDVIQTNVSRFNGIVNVMVSVTEFTDGTNFTEGMSIKASSDGITTVNGHSVNFTLNYNGVRSEGIVASLDVHHNGRCDLPQGDYVSYVRMSYNVA